MAARRRTNRLWKRRFSRWCFTVLGGALNGAGLLLWAQLSGVRFARDQDLNFFERFLGKLTFLWRSLDEKLVLAIGDIPESYLERSEVLANAFIAAGLIALSVPLFQKLRGGRASRSSNRRSRRAR